MMELLYKLGFYPGVDVKESNGELVVFDDIVIHDDGKIIWKDKEISVAEFAQIVRLYADVSSFDWWPEKILSLFPLSTSRVITFGYWDNEGIYIRNNNVLIRGAFYMPLVWLFEPVPGVYYDGNEKLYRIEKEMRTKKNVIIYATKHVEISVSLMQRLFDGFYAIVDVHEDGEKPINTEYSISLHYGPEVVTFVMLEKAPVSEYYDADLAEELSFKKVSGREYLFLGGDTKVYRGDNYIALNERPTNPPDGWFTYYRGDLGNISTRYVGNYRLRYNWENDTLYIKNAFGDQIKKLKGDDLLNIASTWGVDDLVTFLGLL